MSPTLLTADWSHRIMKRRPIGCRSPITDMSEFGHHWAATHCHEVTSWDHDRMIDPSEAWMGCRLSSDIQIWWHFCHEIYHLGKTICIWMTASISGLTCFGSFFPLQTFAAFCQFWVFEFEAKIPFNSPCFLVVSWSRLNLKQQPFSGLTDRRAGKVRWSNLRA